MPIKGKPVTTYLRPKVYEELRVVAADQERSLSWVISEAVRLYVTEKTKNTTVKNAPNWWGDRPTT